MSEAKTPSMFARRTRVTLPLALIALIWVGVGCGGDIEARMAEVRALQDVGQFSASIEELREILAIAPDYPEAAYRLGVALVQTGESSRAVWALQKAAESPQYAVVAGLLLASAHMDNENFEEAVRAADRVLEIDPDRQVALQLRAKGNLGAGRLDEALQDSTRLVELYPEDYSARVLHATVLADSGRLEEAKKAHDLVKELGENSPDPGNRSRSCIAPAMFARQELNSPEKAEPLYEDCIAKYPSDSFVINRSMQFFDSIGKKERATEVIRSAVEQAPENLQLRSTLANRLSNAGRVEEAEKILVEAAERFGTASAWNLLAGFYRREREPEKALEAIEKVIDLAGGGGDQLRFTQADVLVDLGELERAEEVAASLSEPTYATLIRGRILLEQGDAQGALHAFEQGIRNWPNNAGARYLAGVAARELGDQERAVSELREAVRADAKATSAPLLLARMHLARHEYSQAVAMANEALKGPDGQREGQGYLIGARAFTALERYDRARKVIDAFLTATGNLPDATVEMARVERAAEGPAAAVAAIQASKLDPTAPGNEKVLRALADNLIELGRADEALERVDSALARSPDLSDLHQLRGTVLARKGDAERATAAFDKALELDAGNAAAVAGLATLRANAGDASGAIDLFDRAAELDPEQAEYAYSAAQLALASGNPSARERLEAVVRRTPGHAGARNDLAWLLAERGEDLDRALELAEAAVRLNDAPDLQDTLGWVLLKRGESGRAAEVLEKAVEQQPGSPTLLYHFAMALKENGEDQRARETLKRALETPGFPDAEAAGLLLAELERP
jgi:tetratricopeptide (TPR) repeat protein